MILSIDYDVRVSEGKKGYGYKSYSHCCFLTILFVGIASEYLSLDRTAILLLRSLFISSKILSSCQEKPPGIIGHNRAIILIIDANGR